MNTNIRGVPPPGAVRLRERRLQREVHSLDAIMREAGWDGPTGKFADNDAAVRVLQTHGLIPDGLLPYVLGAPLWQ